VVAATLITLNVPGGVSRPSVRVQGRSVALESSSPTVGDVLRAAHQRPSSGAVRAVMSGRVLRPGANPARIAVNGRPASTRTLLHPGDDVRVTNGVDTTEPLVERPVTGPPPPLPAVESGLWRSGRPRVERTLIGEMSGEVVSQSVVEPERPPEPETDKVVALTFDDGPDPEWTPRVMEILRDEGVPATFCVVGSAARRFPALVRAQHDAGHVHCDHTVDHHRLSSRPRDHIAAQIGGAAELLTSIDGV